MERVSSTFRIASSAKRRLLARARRRLLEAQLLRAGYAVGNSDGEQIAEKPRSEDSAHIFSAVNYSVSAEPVQTSTDFGMTSYFRVGWL
jgi:hypothetical protein